MLHNCLLAASPAMLVLTVPVTSTPIFQLVVVGIPRHARPQYSSPFS